VRTEDTSYGEEYFETLDGGAGYQDSTMWEDLAHAIKEVFAIGDQGDHSGELHTIDIGCAKGYLVRHLRRRGIDAWGLDFSEYAISKAPRDTIDFLRQYDLTSPNLSFFGAKNFTFAVCLETMEHIPEHQVDRALGNVFNLVKPGSQVLLTICTDKQPGWDSDPTHVTIKPREWWLDRLINAGFGISAYDRICQDRLRQFWLFSQHDGVFVVTRPE
jgi:cyclopropane fatty-acyl-phospholipid synthase-like methyltransferase